MPQSDTVAFAKHHGLGNDFLVLDARNIELSRLRAAAPWLCGRHRGVGGDGLLLLLAATPRPRMRVINADGTVPEMCGNGLRCFVQWLDDRGHLAGVLRADSDGRERVVIDTDAGPLECWLFRDGDGRVAEVEVELGRVNFEPAAVPLLAEAPLIDAAFDVGGETLHVTALSIGNPHVVTFKELDDATRLRLGPLLEAHSRFPAHINVDFARVLAPAADGTPRLRVDVYERGCGWTQACGTGATASVLAAVHTGRLPADRDVAVQLPGGWLKIRATSAGVGIMRGPATRVFEGSFRLPAQAAMALGPER